MSSNYPPNYPPSAPPQAQQVAAPRKKSPWIWVLAGCGTLLIISIIAIAGIGFFAYRKAQQAGLDPALMQRNPALAAAKIAVTMNPDLEFVSMNEENSTITVRDKKSGKTLTVSAEDIQKGKITLSDDENQNVSIQANSNSGTFEMKTGKDTVKVGAGAAADVPEWVPTYPGVEVAGATSRQSGEGSVGSFQFTTEDSVESVLDYFEDAFQNHGLQVKINSAKVNGEVGSGTATAKDAAGKRSAMVIISSTGTGTSVIVTYQDKS